MKPIKPLKGYRSRVIKQSLWWVNGIPRHNHVDGECCADFSCCVPDLFTKDKRGRMEIHGNLIERLNRDDG